MPTPESLDLSTLLEAVRAGDALAKNRLFEVVYAEMRRISGWLMRTERPDHTLQPTALVNEAFLRLCQGKSLGAVPNRSYFFGAVTRAMRQVLSDHAEARAAGKRGGGLQRVLLDDVLDHLEARNIQVSALREALERLEAINERQAQVVTLKFLHGYTIPEIGERLEVSESTVESDWRFARAWLRSQLKENP
jgi:RNA polymerase sigma factor (TIGR02999 family)